MALIDKYDANGIHVHAWTLFIGIGSIACALFGLLFSTLGLFDLVLHNTTMITPFHFEKIFFEKSTMAYIQVIEVLIKSLLLLAVSSILVYANRKLKPTLYWPFIVYSLISLWLFLLRLVLVVDVELYLWIRDFGKPQKVVLQDQKYSTFTAPVIIALVLLWIQVLFYKIVQRGRTYLIELEKDEKIRNLNVE